MSLSKSSCYPSRYSPSLDYIRGAYQRIILLALVKAPAGYIAIGGCAARIA
jgi:hypothetical protein